MFTLLAGAVRRCARGASISSCIIAGSFAVEAGADTPDTDRVIDQVVVSLENGDEEEAKYMFGQLGSNSIDYALMEKAANVAVVAAQFEWDDLGSWDALSRSLPNDERGNVSHGNARIVDSDRCVVYNDAQDMRVSVLGLEDVVVAVTDGEVLVCRKDRAQDVRTLAD